METKTNGEIRLFCDGQEIGDVIPTITLSDDSEQENPFNMNEISATIKLNWWNRMKMKFYLWKIFRKQNKV